MTASNVKVAILGCGRIVRLVHANILRSIPGVELVAFSDTDAQNRAAIMAGSPGAMGYADYQTAIDEAHADAVVIALPPAIHADSAIAALAAGKHVYLEKPVAIDSAQAHSLISAWRGSSQQFAMGFNFRFHPLLNELARAIQANELGEIVTVRSAFSVPPRQQPAWRSAREHGGGALLELGSHHMDMIHVLFGGDVESVSADIRSLRFGADSAAVQCRLATGATVQSSFSTVAPAEDWWEVVGTAARVRVDRENGKVSIDNVSGPGGRIASLQRRMATAIDAFRGVISSSPDPSHPRSLSTFIDSVRTGKKSVAADPSDGWRSLCLVLAAEESANTGRAIDPRTFPDYSRGSASVN